jgi:hypothetical protein
MEFIVKKIALSILLALSLHANNNQKMAEASSLVVNHQEKKGFEIFLKLAQEGNPKAQEIVGNMYLSGMGTSQSDKKAIYWLEKSAQQGDVKSQHSLGLIYREYKNFNQAMFWFKKSADQNNGDSQYELAKIYRLGQGVAQNFEEAFKWYLKAAKANNGDA